MVQGQYLQQKIWVMTNFLENQKVLSTPICLEKLENESDNFLVQVLKMYHFNCGAKWTIRIFASKLFTGQFNTEDYSAFKDVIL